MRVGREYRIEQPSGRTGGNRQDTEAKVNNIDGTAAFKMPSATYRRR